MLRPVDVATELAALFAQLADTRQREHLEAAGVGEDGAVPRVELVQSSSLVKNVETRTQIQVIGVSKDDLCLYLFAQFREVHALHRAACPYGHEDRCLDLSVIGGYQAGACL